MTNSLALLAQPHDEAVRTIIQEALKPGVDVDDLHAGQYQVRPDGRMDLPVYIDSDAYDNQDWPYRGSVEMIYNRVDLHEALDHLGLKFRLPDANYTTTFVVEKLQSILQLHFDPADYIHESFEVLTATRMVTLRATEDSPRWKGQVDVFIYR
jgi:hypothetical protein